MIFNFKKKKHHYYWVSYNYSEGSECGTGAAEINISPSKITTYKDIELIKNFINDKLFNGKATIVVRTYIYMRTERKEYKDESSSDPK